MALEGIDVSYYQGDIDWPTVASQGVFYGFAKATEGASSNDPSFARNWAGMKTVGLVRGAYHFFRAGKDPIVQANNFLQQIKGKYEPSDLPPVLDLEILDNLDAATVIDRAARWISAIESATGRKPIIYSYPVFWEEKLGNTTRFSAYPLWIANFGTRDPFVPSAWKSWAFHQYSETGTVKGIDGNVDLNQFNGDLDGLQKLLKGKIPLSVGCKGQVVKELQELLNAKGFNLGTADGSFGPRTKATVIAFQQSRKLPATGVVGSETWAALLSNASPTPTPTPTPTPSPTPTPTPTPSPTPTPTPTPVLPSISLISVCKSYRSLPHQDQALTWLQGQIPKATIDEFARRWRQNG